MRYATASADYGLPRPEPTPPSIFSVPRKGGGYTYYRSPPGVAPGLGDNWPDPSIAHPNPIGVASITIGRPLPPGSVPVGEGWEARGSITPLPGAGGKIPMLDASLGSDAFDPENPWSHVLLIGGGLLAGFLIGSILKGSI